MFNRTLATTFGFILLIIAAVAGLAISQAEIAVEYTEWTGGEINTIEGLEYRLFEADPVVGCRIFAEDVLGSEFLEADAAEVAAAAVGHCDCIVDTMGFAAQAAANGNTKLERVPAAMAIDPQISIAMLGDDDSLFVAFIDRNNSGAHGFGYEEISLATDKMERSIEELASRPPAFLAQFPSCAESNRLAAELVL